jgi:cytochrome c6
MRRLAGLWLLVGVTVCASCGGTKVEKSPVAVNSCSDAGFTEAVSPLLAALDSAVLKVDAGHGDVGALGAAAPRLVSAARLLRNAARSNSPCRAALLRAQRLVLASTKELSSAGHDLELLANAAKKGEDYSSFESRFLTNYFDGTGKFNASLASLRVAGAPGLVSASDGKGIFTEAGCATCHTLAAAGARGKIGPNLDAVMPSTSAVVDAVTNGSGPMLSFKGKLSAEQIQAVAQFVSKNAGK